MEQHEIVLTQEVSRRVMMARLATGLVQGLLLYWLYRAAKEGFWPADAAYVMAPLVLLGLMLPVVLISSMGHMAPRKTALWALVAGAILVLLALHDSWRSAGLAQLAVGEVSRPERNAPSWNLVCCGAGFLYIAHALVMAGAREGRRIASYTSYFEVAWKLAVQLLFSLFFVGALWVVLWMGAGLFDLVKLHFLRDLLRKDWFYVPVICFAWSCAMHITDVRPSIVCGVRTLLLVLSSWLLPVAVLIICVFLCTLPFTGLHALWETRHATSLLLATSAVLIMLINAAFQNGDARVALVIRVSARTAALLLLPLAGIAVYALGLRVHDYGWTVDRIVAAACLVVALCYAVGYQWSAHQYDSWLLPIARINVWTSFVVLAVLLALFTPIADPARLSVHNQMARLAKGKITADKLDYIYLRFDGKRYGRAALEQLAAQGNTQAADALKLKDRWQPRRRESTPAEVATNIAVLPAGAKLPASFLTQKWEGSEYPMQPACLTVAEQKCNAMLGDVDGDGKQDVLLFDAGFYTAYLYAEVSGKWTMRGIMLPNGCPALRQRLKEGQFTLAAPSWKALEVAGVQMPFATALSNEDCAALK